MSQGTKYRFTVKGPVLEMGRWQDADAAQFLWGAHSPEPMTMAEIEELVAVFDGNSAIIWDDDLTGEYTSPTDYDLDKVGTYRISLQAA